MTILPKISIILPVLNSGALLEKALQSVIAQNYANVELIVLDGGSTDNTVEIINKYSAHIHYWHSLPDKGPNDAINKGIQLATGDLINILMADDWYEPDTFSLIAATFNKHPQLDMITCLGKIVSYNEKSKKYNIEHAHTNTKQLDLTFYNVCFKHSALCCRFISKKLYEHIGTFEIFDNEGNPFVTSDKEFLLRAILNNAQNITLNHYGHNYLAHDGSSTFSKQKPNILKLYKEHMGIAKSYLANKNVNTTQRSCLKRWYFDNQIRLMLRTLSARNYKYAWCLAKIGICEAKLAWFKHLSATLAAILKKKLLGGI